MKDEKFSISEGVISQKVGDEIVLLDLEGEEYFSLNEVGARIWQLLSDGRTPTEIISALLDEYEATEQQLQADVQNLISGLQERGLVSTEA